ncbi:hypothetical protein SELMODRAFT_448410 [Selaginella moellendorffii]|uniref:F-box domain-containing protein n=1 Tax=Selaginella moellendorffii TaxID=88036 RepID=D8T744_SELML|nr:hypothetical protein SELMODRAFT_448410 [Selaginella moellendorffii]
MANQELVKSAREEERRRLQETVKKLEHICLENKVRVKIVSIVSSEGSLGKVIVQHAVQLQARALFMIGPSQKGLKWKFSRHFSTSGYVKKNVPRWCAVHIVSHFGDTDDSSSCSPRLSKSSSQSSLFSINHSKPLDDEPQEDDTIVGLEDWLDGKSANILRWRDITQIALEISSAVASSALEHDEVTASSILLRGKHLHKVLAYEGHEIVQPLEKTSRNISSFELLLLQLLARRPSPSSLAERFQDALRQDKLEALLDPAAGWPLKTAKEIAVLALECRRAAKGDSKIEELRALLTRSLGGDEEEDDEETVMKLDLDFFQRTTRFSRSEDGLYVDMDFKLEKGSSREGEVWVSGGLASSANGCSWLLCKCWAISEDEEEDELMAETMATDPCASPKILINGCSPPLKSCMKQAQQNHGLQEPLLGGEHESRRDSSEGRCGLGEEQEDREPGSAEDNGEAKVEVRDDMDEEQEEQRENKEEHCKNKKNVQWSEEIAVVREYEERSTGREGMASRRQEQRDRSAASPSAAAAKIACQEGRNRIDRKASTGPSLQIINCALVCKAWRDACSLDVRVRLLERTIKQSLDAGFLQPLDEVPHVLNFTPGKSIQTLAQELQLTFYLRINNGQRIRLTRKQAVLFPASTVLHCPFKYLKRGMKLFSLASLEMTKKPSLWESDYSAPPLRLAMLSSKDVAGAMNLTVGTLFEQDNTDGNEEVLFIKVGIHLAQVIFKLFKFRLETQRMRPNPEPSINFGYHVSVQLHTFDHLIWTRNFHGFEVVPKKLSLPWRSEAFSGTLEHSAMAVITSWDVRREAFWQIVKTLHLKLVSVPSVEYVEPGFEGPQFEATVEDKSKGLSATIKCSLPLENSVEVFAITDLRLSLSKKFVREWFGVNI